MSAQGDLFKEAIGKQAVNVESGDLGTITDSLWIDDEYGIEHLHYQLRIPYVEVSKSGRKFHRCFDAIYEAEIIEIQ
jgi:hypothetical protein